MCDVDYSNGKPKIYYKYISKCKRFIQSYKIEYLHEIVKNIDILHHKYIDCISNKNLIKMVGPLIAIVMEYYDCYTSDFIKIFTQNNAHSVYAGHNEYSTLMNMLHSYNFYPKLDESIISFYNKLGKDKSMLLLLMQIIIDTHIYQQIINQLHSITNDTSPISLIINT